ncbi:MAG TPA: hypothetical protein VMH35_23365 [Streptosporangiaceae bacterium]|nr:hypothetical protein [Streptosporangiaceae bacterium]
MDSSAAETHVRLLAEAELRQATRAPRYGWLDDDFRTGGEPPGEVGLLRVKAVLSALDLVGAVSAGTAQSVLGEFTSALAARGLAPAEGLLRVVLPGEGEPAAGQPAEPAAPPGAYRAIPIAAVIPAGWEGYQGDVHVQTLILAPGSAMIITMFVSTWREVASLPGGTVPGQPSFPPFGDSGLTDDQGRRYQLDYQAAEGGWFQYGVLSISPVPPAGVQWLDMPTGAGPALRIQLAQSVPAARVTSQRIQPAAAGEHLLTAVGDTLLGGGAMAGISATAIAASLAEVADALRAVQVLPDDSVTAAHLAALCQRRSIEVRGPLADRARTAGLPRPWADVLAQGRGGPGEGRPGVVPVGAVLPEIDGARFVLAGLSSWERQVSMPVLVWGWSPWPRVFRSGQPFSWWARDDTGCWHVGRTSPYQLIARTFHVEFTPPLHPDATSLDIMLSGSAARVTVSVPLCWPDEPARAPG